MGYTVIIQPEAEEELAVAFDYLNSIKPDLGFDLLAAIAEIVTQLEDNPFQFQKVYQEKRRANIKRFQYNLIYKIIHQDVYILAIIHGSRNPKLWEDG
jgi:plasmid stabilization system protein ParE